MKVELVGVELFGYHGVGEAERADGQRFIYDVALEVGEQGRDDRIEHAVDYRLVASCLKEVASGQFHLLEALAASIADTLLERFPVDLVTVRVRKPEVRPAGLELEFSAVTVERRRPAGGP